MSGQKRRRRPRPARTRKRGRVRSSIVFGSGVLGLTAALVLPHVDTMAWLGITSDGEDSRSAALRLLDAEGETPGEKVAVVVVKESKPKGFDSAKMSAVVSDAFGLTCVDGPVAWASARTRSWKSSEGEGRITALVYPAGGGGAAFAQVSAAATQCAEDATESEYGVEGVDWGKGDSVVRVLRHGDVLAVVSGTSAAAIPDNEWIGELDNRLGALVGVECVDPKAPAQASLRNPFIDPEAFTGNAEAVTVEFPDVTVTRAEEVATDPVIALDAIPPQLPPEVLPLAPLDPEAPGLSEMPTAVERPQAPVPPVKTEPVGQVMRAIEDPQGPGCGWDFTAQAVPRFDAERAERAYTAALSAERNRLVEEAVAFEQGKVNFYRAWSEYLSAATAYEQYLARVSEVNAEWQVVIDARNAFVAAFDEFRRAEEAAADFSTRQSETQAAYDAELLRCQGLSPIEALLPGSGCPPVRPPILDEFAPAIPARPVPSPQALLPIGWEPPALG